MSVINVDLPDSIAEQLEGVAKNKFEMEKFVVIAVAEKLGYLQARAKRADLNKFDRILSKIPTAEAEEFDKL